MLDVDTDFEELPRISLWTTVEAAEAAIETAVTAHLAAVAAGKAGAPSQTIREARNNLTAADGALSALRSEWTRLQEAWKVGA